jgi:hypothetical protein
MAGPGLPRKIQAESKSHQIQQSQAKDNQRKSLNFLVRIEPFHGLTPTPKALFLCPPQPLVAAPAARVDSPLLAR